MASMLSNDVIIEILSRTSLESFDAMRCTSKYYNKLSYSSYLVNLYKQRNNIVSGLIMQKITDSKNPGREFVPSHNSDGLDLSFLSETTQIIASSDQGILVLESLPHPDVLLHQVCKPATKQLIQLPFNKNINRAFEAAIAVLSSKPLHYKIIRLSRPHTYGVISLWKFYCDVFDSKLWKWKSTDTIRFPYAVTMRGQTITTRGSIYCLLTEYDIWKFDTYSEKWTTFSIPEPAHNFKVYPYRKLIKFEGKLGFACQQYNGFWEIWVLTDDESWEKTYVLDKEDDTKRMSLEALYDSDTSVMLDHNIVLFHRFKGDNNINNEDHIEKVRPRRPPYETFVFRSDYEPIELMCKLKLTEFKIFDSSYYLEQDKGAVIGRSTFTKIKRTRVRKPPKSRHPHTFIPRPFLCPISEELMCDPVIIETNQTFDRCMIKKWFKEGNTTCPKTGFDLHNQNLTPNKVIADLIKDWIVVVEQCGFSDGYNLEKNDRRVLAILLSKLSSTLSDQKDAARKLRLLTSRETFAGRFLGESQKYITRLINPLLQMSLEGEIDVDIQKDIITSIFYIASNVSNTRILIETPNLIDVVTSGFKSVSNETKRMALAAISELSNLEPNAILICEWATLNRFVGMLIDHDRWKRNPLTLWNPLLGQDIATTMSKLFLFEENRDKAARTGVVLLLYNELRNWGYMEGLSSVLVMLSRGKRVVEALHDMEASAWLLQTIKEIGAEQVQENFVVILYNMHVYIPGIGGCSNLKELNKLRKIEKTHMILAWLATHGTEKAKNSANSLLDCVG